MFGKSNEVEYFGVYSPDTRKVYMISADECYAEETSLRLAATGKQGKNQYSDFLSAAGLPAILSL